MCKSEAHVSIEALWKYRADNIPSSRDEDNHLYVCNECLAILGMCQLSQTIEEVERLKQGKPRRSGS
jgi:hypothetical protein